MSSRILEAMKNKNVKHGVGNINNWSQALINLGAIVTGSAIDNFEIVELDWNEEGERICKKLSDTTKKGYLICSVEDYLEEFGEDISDFFNSVGEKARIGIQETGRRFEVSNFKADNNSKEIKNGQKVHYDATEGVYIVSNNTTDNSNYATAGNKYHVVDADAGVLGGQQLIRLEID